MRIVAGQHRGRQLEAPAGKETRPTSDRVREALFSMLEARCELQGAAVLDLYAGSGALGLEALSRGAGRAVFVDRLLACERAISANVRALRLEASCRVLREEVQVALARLSREGERFELVLCDPPYADDADMFLGSLDAHELISEGGVLAFEHSARVEPAEIHGALSLLVRRRHGDTALSLYRRRTVL